MNKIHELFKKYGLQLRSIVQEYYKEIIKYPPEQQIKLLNTLTKQLSTELVSIITKQIKEAKGIGRQQLRIGSSKKITLSDVYIKKLSERIHTVTNTYKKQLEKTITQYLQNGTSLDKLTKKLTSLKTTDPKIIKQMSDKIKALGDLSGPEGQIKAQKLIKRFKTNINNLKTSKLRSGYKEIISAIQSGNKEIIDTATKHWALKKNIYTNTVIARSESIKTLNTSFLDQLKDPNTQLTWKTAPGCCELCEEIASKTYSKDNCPIPITDSHPNCKCIIITQNSSFDQ